MWQDKCLCNRTYSRSRFCIHQFLTFFPFEKRFLASLIKVIVSYCLKKCRKKGKIKIKFDGAESLKERN